MSKPVTYEELEADRERMTELGITPRSGPRTRTRDPKKAALLRAAGVPEEQIGPVGPRRYFSAPSPERREP